MHVDMRTCIISEFTARVRGDWRGGGRADSRGLFEEQIPIYSQTSENKYALHSLTPVVFVT
jgi:hypothetical protein